MRVNWGGSIRRLTGQARSAHLLTCRRRFLAVSRYEQMAGASLCRQFSWEGIFSRAGKIWGAPPAAEWDLSRLAIEIFAPGLKTSARPYPPGRFES